MNIDLSKLKRKPINLATVQKARFLFPGWSPMRGQAVYGDGVVMSEEEWNNHNHEGKYIQLKRKGEASLTVRWCSHDPAYTVDEPGWLLEGRSISRYCRQVVCVSRDVDFETLVKCVEIHLLRAHERYDYNVIKFQDAEMRNPRAYEFWVDGLMRTWKQSQEHLA